MKRKNNISVTIKGCALYGVVALIVLCCFACSDASELSHPEEPLCTILFYMGGDNNLSAEVNAKIEQIKTAPLPPDCRVIIYKDTREEAPQLIQWTTDNGQLSMRVVRQYDESNSASAETFGAVLREVQALYPTPTYGLVLFSHASGWLPEGTLNNPALRELRMKKEELRMNSRSVVIDGTAEMEIPAFAAAIPDGMLSFIVFEACYMASVEVAYELKDKTRHIVASSAEIVSPGFARCYAEALPHLYRGDLSGFCRTVEADYRTRTGDYASLTLSLINTKNLDALAAALHESSFDFLVETSNQTIRMTGSGTASIQTFDRNDGTLFFDLGDCFRQLLPEQEAGLLFGAIAPCIEWKSATATFMPTYGGFAVKAHSGLTMYLPQPQYPRLNEAYKQLKWYRAILGKHNSP